MFVMLTGNAKMILFPLWYIVYGCLFGSTTGESGDLVVSAYLVSEDNTTCLGLDAMSASSPTSMSQQDLAGSCVKLLLVEGTSGTTFKLKKLEAQSSVMKLQTGQIVEFVTDSTETQVHLFSGSLLLTATANSVDSITSSNQAFLIQLVGADVSDGLGHDGTYSVSNASPPKWYFIEVECQVENCDECQVDAFLCNSCAANSEANEDMKICEVITTTTPASSSTQGSVAATPTNGCSSETASRVGLLALIQLVAVKYL